MQAPCRRSAEEQINFILECRTSGLSDHQWCLEHNIKPGTFYSWVKRLRKKGCSQIPNSSKARIVPLPKQDVVQVRLVEDIAQTVEPPSNRHPAPPHQEAPITDWTMEISCRDGMQIRLSNGIRAELLHTLLMGLESRPVC